jgi:hypothetical protein
LYNPALYTRQKLYIETHIFPVVNENLKIPTVKIEIKDCFIGISQFESEQVNIEQHGRFRMKVSFFTPFFYLIAFPS